MAENIINDIRIYEQFILYSLHQRKAQVSETFTILHANNSVDLKTGGRRYK